MRFRIDLKIFVFLILFYFTKQIEVYAMIMLFAIIHELGHLLAGILLGMKPEKLEIMPYGVSITFKLNIKDYNQKILCGNQLELKKIMVAFAGPITNLLVIIVFLHMKLNIFYVLMVTYANLLIMIFNLLPIYPLDGGRILMGIFHLLLGKEKAEKFSNQISFFTLIFITFIASILIYKVKNIAIFLIILFLWGMYIKEDIIFRKRCKIYNLLEKGIEIK